MRPLFTADPLFHAGCYYVQEASSMFAGYVYEQLMSARAEAVRVLDLCAAPGGKSTHIASLMKDQDLLIANETIQTRSSILAENLTKWGYMNTWVTNNDPRDIGRLGPYFDCMLIDAPCTGSGLWRKDVHAIEEWSPEHVQLCSDRQRRIIADALPALKDEGILIYATCSYSPEENEAIADWIAATFDVESLRIELHEDWGVIETQSDKGHAYCYRFYPWKVLGEGFFLAAFKVSQTGSTASYKSKQKAKKTTTAKLPIDRWEPYLDVAFALSERNDEYFAIHPTHQIDYELLAPQLKIRKGGLRLGKILPKEVIPDHELALSIHLRNDLPAVALDQEQAMRYLKKEEVKKEHAKGWMLARYQGQALGWGKWMPNRMNNYLPKNWRIRMDIADMW
jgi:NOL1/NOP2/fmu family ribosome biogenesis protein